jgi:hypothetical protein
VRDFHSSEGDHIWLDRIYVSFSTLQTLMKQVGDDTVIDLSGYTFGQTSTLILPNVDMSTLTPGDFILA